jgi:hypothetical protein
MKGDVSERDTPSFRGSASSSFVARRSSFVKEETALFAGASRVGWDLLKEVFRLNHDMEKRVIPINVDTLPGVNGDTRNREALMAILNTLALKQLKLNIKYGPNKINFAFVRITKEGRMEEVTSHEIISLYNSLKRVKDYNLQIAHIKGEEMPSSAFVITDLGNLPSKEANLRPIVVESRLELVDNSHPYLWGSILDIAIAQTILLGQEEDIRKRYYPRLLELYKGLLKGKDIRIEDLTILFQDDIPKAIDTAIRLAIPPMERMDMESLKLLYELMMEEVEKAV